MTFLEWICERLLGPPEARKGEERWVCPWCEHRGFHIRPHKPPYRDRWSCWSCGQWGDGADLVRFYYPREDYGRRLDRLDQLRAEWEHELSSPGIGENQLEGIPAVFSPETAAVLETAMRDGWRLDELLFDLAMKLLERGEEIKARGTPANGRTEATGVTS